MDIPFTVITDRKEARSIYEHTFELPDCMTCEVYPEEDQESAYKELGDFLGVSEYYVEYRLRRLPDVPYNSIIAYEHNDHTKEVFVITTSLYEPPPTEEDTPEEDTPEEEN